MEAVQSCLSSAFEVEEKARPQNPFEKELRCCSNEMLI